MKKYYIAGKITGDPEYRAKFARAADWLRTRFPGCVVLSPAELPEGLRPRDYMRICAAMLEAADEAVFLPDWTDSAGAAIEMRLCKYSGINWRIIFPVPTIAELSAEDVNCHVLCWDEARFGAWE